MPREERPELYPQVELHTVLAIARPPRVALGVPEGVNLGDWRNLLEKAASRWGGLDSTIYFPTAQWAPGNVWDDLLTLFDPDEIFWSREPENASMFSERYAPFRVHGYKWMFHPDGDPPPVNWSVRTSAAARAWLAQPREDPMYSIDDGAVEGGQPCLEVLLAQEFGRLPREEVDGLTAGGIAPIVMPIQKRIDLSDPDQAPRTAFRAAYGGYTGRGAQDARPRRWSAVGLSVWEHAGSEGWREGPIVVCGSSPADVCLWLTLRALRHSANVFWWPDEMVPGESADGDDPRHGYVASLAERLSKFEDTVDIDGAGDDQYDHDAIQVTSVTVPEEQLRSRWGSILLYRRCLRPPRFGSDPMPALRTRRFQAVSQPQEVACQFTGGVSHAYIAPDLPPWITAGTRPPTFLTEFSVDGFSAPAHPVVPPLLAPHRPPPMQHRSGRYGPVAAQCSRIVLASGPRRLVPLQIRYPDVSEILGRYGEWLKGTALPSNSGRLATDLVVRLGGLKEAGRAVRFGGFVNLLDALLRKYQEGAAPDGHFPVRDRVFIDNAALQSVVRDSAGALDPSAIMGEWTTRGLIHWGMLLKCPMCRYQEFYRWEALHDAGIVCLRCSREFDLSPATACAWAPVAGLDELVKTSVENDSREEIALAAWLLSQDGDGAVALGTEWECPGATTETDVAGVVNGHLVLAEAKSGDNVALKQLRQYENLARRTQARRVIFATSCQRWSDGTAGRTEALRERLPGASVELYVDVLGHAGPTLFHP